MQEPTTELPKYFEIYTYFCYKNISILRLPTFFKLASQLFIDSYFFIFSTFKKNILICFEFIFLCIVDIIKPNFPISN